MLDVWMHKATSENNARRLRSKNSLPAPETLDGMSKDPEGSVTEAPPSILSSQLSFLSTVTNCAELYSTEAQLQAVVIIGPLCGTTRNGGYTMTASGKKLTPKEKMH